MTRAVRVLLLLAAAAIVTPSQAQQAANPSPAPAAEPTKQCVTARKKVDVEQRSLVQATDSLARDKKARESCSSKSMCSRYDTAISAGEKRRARHETRLARFKEDVDKACKAP
jgi:hypothetical protein